MSKQTYDTLTPEDQEIVKTSLKAAVDWGVEEAIKREESNLETLKNEGVQVQELDVSTFEEITSEVREEFSRQSDIVKSFLETAQ